MQAVVDTGDVEDVHGRLDAIGVDGVEVGTTCEPGCGGVAEYGDVWIGGGGRVRDID